MALHIIISDYEYDSWLNEYLSMLVGKERTIGVRVFSLSCLSISI